MAVGFCGGVVTGKIEISGKGASQKRFLLLYQSNSHVLSCGFEILNKPVDCVFAPLRETAH